MSAPTGIGSMVAVVTRDFECQGCRKTFTTDVALLAGRLKGPELCPECRLALAEERRKLDAEVQLAARQRQAAKARDAAIAGLDVPALYADVSLETFTLHGTAADQDAQRRALEWAARYLRVWPYAESLLLFRGAPGTGKGHVVWSLAKAIADKGDGACVVKLADLVRSLRASWRDPEADTELAVLRRYREVPFLAIDEVSRHAFYGQQIHQHLYDVLDHRLEQQRPTVLTSNEDDAGIAEILRPALFDRLLGAGGVVEFGTASYRARPR